MGEDKATLPWRGTTSVAHLSRVLHDAVDGPVIVVGRPPGTFVGLAPGTIEVDDPVAHRGPLQGIATGLAALTGRAGTAFVCATDLPAMHADFVRVVLDALGDADIALPVAHGFRQPLAAGYRTELAARAQALADEGHPGPDALLTTCRVHVLDETALRTDPRLARSDPHLHCLTNVNTREDYETLRTAPPVRDGGEWTAPPSAGDAV
jgi:molybdopterin-guanine dinucleotide biosynthesis protein A